MLAPLGILKPCSNVKFSSCGHMGLEATNLVHIVLDDSVWDCAQRCRPQPPQGLFHDTSGVWKDSNVFITRHFVRKLTIQFLLCLLLDLRVQNHGQNERVKCRRSRIGASFENRAYLYLSLHWTIYFWEPKQYLPNTRLLRRRMILSLVILRGRR